MKSTPHSARLLLTTSCQSLLLTALAFCLPGALQAQTHTLESGATTWDLVSPVWRNTSNQAVTYPNSSSTQPQINGPVVIAMAEPHALGSLTLNNGVTIGSTLADYMLFADGSIINGTGSGTNVFNTKIEMFSGGTTGLTVIGRHDFNRNVSTGAGHPFTLSAPGTVGLNSIFFNSPTLNIGTPTDTNLCFFNTTSSVVTVAGNMTVGQVSGNVNLRNSYVASTGTSYDIGGDLRLGHAGNCNFSTTGGYVSLGGALRLADDAVAGPVPNAVAAFRNTTLTVADSGGAGIRGTFFTTGGDIGVTPSLSFPGTRIAVRAGGFLTMAPQIGCSVSNTIVDTTGGNARFDGRLWAYTLIKEGPGILKLTRDNYYGSPGSNGTQFPDATVVRGGFIEFTESANLGDGGAFWRAVTNDPIRSNLQDINPSLTT